MSNDTQIAAHMALVDDLTDNHAFMDNWTYQKARAAVEASARQLAEQPEGMKLVPASPTMEVRKHLEGKVGVDFLIAYADWCRPLTASPTAPSTEASEPVREREDFARRYEWLRAQVWNENTLAVVLRPKDNTKLGCFLPFGKLLDDAIDHMSADGTAPTPLPLKPSLRRDDLSDAAGILRAHGHFELAEQFLGAAEATPPPAPVLSDAEILDWLEANVKETPLNPGAYDHEDPDRRLRYEFPTLVSYDCIGQQISLRDAIRAAIGRASRGAK